MNFISWLSRTTIVVHRRDDEGVGVAHEIKSPKNQLQFYQTTMEQHWLGKAKTQTSFQIDLYKCFQKLLQN